MKKIKLITIIICLLLLTSCTHKVIDEKSNVTTENTINEEIPVNTETNDISLDGFTGPCNITISGIVEDYFYTEENVYFKKIDKDNYEIIDANTKESHVVNNVSIKIEK